MTRPSDLRWIITVFACLLVLLSFWLGRPSFLGAVRTSDDTAFDMNQYSIWAMPAEGTQFYERTSAAINAVSTKRGCTPFEPHVTVIGAFGTEQGLSEEDVVSRTKHLAQSLKPYTVKVKELSSGQHFFQCVYLKVDPSEEVLHVNKEARSIMGMDLQSGYMPHMSLIYGDLSEKEKEQVKIEIRDSFADLVDGGTAWFQVSSLVLYRTPPNDVSMKTWERLGVFPLEA